MNSSVQPILWAGDHLRLLDQRVLPHEERYLDCRTPAEVATAIHDMVVRGAPAIGIAAAYGLVLAGGGAKAYDAAEAVLAASRPTAINLHWALAQMRGVQRTGADRARLLQEAQRIHQEDLAQNRRMAELGAALLPRGARVLTHCNTGALATGGHGTALGVIRTANEQGKLAQVYASETRPWLQGARLTVWELREDGIPATLIADAAGAHLMKTGAVDWLVVGADRICANGDVANKIGTYQHAIAAKHHGVKVMVVAPASTVDMATPDGDAIHIEERSGDELLAMSGVRTVAEGVQAFNPVFDVTPAALIDALVTERGVIAHPDGVRMAAVFGPARGA